MKMSVQARQRFLSALSIVVMFLLWEVVTGRRISDRFMERAVTFGFFLLLALMVYVNGLDVWRSWFK